MFFAPVVNIPGNAATATTAAACSGNAATATTAAACSGNAATATTAAACSGNAATVTSITTAQVLNATAGLAQGAVGSYAFVSNSAGMAFGSTYAGASLQPVGLVGTPSGTLSGTWRCVGHAVDAADGTLVVRTV